MTSSTKQGKDEPSKDTELSSNELKWDRALSPRLRARLTPIRDLGPTPPPPADGSNPGRTTFSRSCNRVGREQQEMSVFDVRRVYSNCELFKNCSAEFVRSLLDEGGAEARQGEIYDPNAVIVQQGTVGHAMYLIHRGEAEVLLNGTMVAKLSAGAHFGEMQLLGLTPMRTATVRSLTICHIFEVRSEVFVRLLLRFRQERRLFEREAMRRYRELAEVRRQQKRRQRQIEQTGIGMASESTGKSIRGEVRVSISEEMANSIEAAVQGGGEVQAGTMRALRKQQTKTLRDQLEANRTSQAHHTQEANKNESGTSSIPVGKMSVPPTASTTVGTSSVPATAMGGSNLATAGEFAPNDEIATPSQSKDSIAGENPKSADPDSPRRGSNRGLQGMPSTVLGRGFPKNKAAQRMSAESKKESGVLSSNEFREVRRASRELHEVGEDLTQQTQQKSAEEETFVQRVARSLRTDTKRGFMAASSSWVPPLNSTWRDLNPEDDDYDDAAQILETRLLPPIALLSPAQKQGLLRQLRQQAHSKLRRGVNKLNVGRVLKSLKSTGLSLSTGSS